MSFMKMKKEDIGRVGLKFGGNSQKKADHDVVIRVGNKVLPVNESITTLSSSKYANLDLTMKKEKGDQKTIKTISKLKLELLRWAAAAAKSDIKGGKYIARKVSQFRNKTTSLKALQNEDQMTDDSPKISFRWEVESCCTFSSALSASSANRNHDHEKVNIEIHSDPDDENSRSVTLRSNGSGSWITTDSDFVVLEL